MYNSITMVVLVNIWNVIERSYEYSVFKKIIDGIVKGLKYISNGSNFINLFASDESLFEKSFFYAMYCKVIDAIYRFLNNINKRINNHKEESIVSNLVNSSFKDEVALQRTLYVFFLTFGIGVIVNNLIRGKFSGRSYFIALILIVVSVLGLRIKENYKNILKSSIVFRIVESIFSADEGGEQWW